MNTALLGRRLVERQPSLTRPIDPPRSSRECGCQGNCHESCHHAPSEADPNVTDAQLELIATEAFLQEGLIEGHGGCCGDDPDICHCQCSFHVPGSMMEHVSPCCERSPCGLDIKVHALEMHIAGCNRCKEIAQENAR